MAAAVRLTADNANSANDRMRAADSAVNEGTASMESMSEAIKHIKVSSDETAKILKTIDEIAFQTNLLALNAAVEAARAGDAGKGFAVVAEEVRNLAQRSAEAAKSTSRLIEESRRNADMGVNTTEAAIKTFREITGHVEKAASLVQDLSMNTTEQSQHLGQLTETVSQLDKVAQSNAAGAEECASAAEELSAQAEELNVTVFRLASVVGGSSDGETVGSPAKALPLIRVDKNPVFQLASSNASTRALEGPAARPELGSPKRPLIQHETEPGHASR